MISLLLALACFPVDGSKLLAKHFAPAVTEFASLAPDAELGHAPVPGAKRVLRPDELHALGQRHGLTVAVRSEPVCFEWKTALLDDARALEAMRQALPADAQVTIQEVSRTPVPDGQVVFPLETLKAGLWRGYVRYDQSRRFDVWARVQVKVPQTRVVAAKALKAGEMLSTSHLRLEEFESEPDTSAVQTLEEAIGRSLKAPLPEGASLVARLLERPNVVTKGDAVRLHAIAGAAQVTVDAQAQASGRVGEVIPVKNATSGRIIRARVEGSGEVVWTP